MSTRKPAPQTGPRPGEAERPKRFQVALRVNELTTGQMKAALQYLAGYDPDTCEAALDWAVKKYPAAS